MSSGMGMDAGGSIGQAIMEKYGRYHITLIHSRYPLDEFVYDRATGENNDDVDTEEQREHLYHPRPGQNRPQISGQWGTMMMITGPKITHASFTPRVPHWRGGEHTEELDFVGRKLQLGVMGKDVPMTTKLFTTVERFRTDAGNLNQWGFGYVRMKSREEPYGLRNEPHNAVVKKYLKRGNGSCIRVLGGETDQQQAILIHDAPHVGFVIGCIGPRPYNDRKAYKNVANNPSDKAVQEIMGQLAKAHGKGTLFVLKN
jgi:hypothetical protein